MRNKRRLLLLASLPSGHCRWRSVPLCSRDGATRAALVSSRLREIVRQTAPSFLAAVTAGVRELEALQMQV